MIKQVASYPLFYQLLTIYNLLPVNYQQFTFPQVIYNAHLRLCSQTSAWVLQILERLTSKLQVGSCLGHSNENAWNRQKISMFSPKIRPNHVGHIWVKKTTLILKITYCQKTHLVGWCIIFEHPLTDDILKTIGCQELGLQLSFP